MDFIERDQERLIRLALLSVPEVREAAGYAARGPLTHREIADFVGVSQGTVAHWEAKAIASFRAALRREGMLEDFEQHLEALNENG